jgi:leader peptidase (prepilin peptidase) / N-methyltransferase
MVSVVNSFFRTDMTLSPELIVCYIFIFLFGITIGSFLNVCIWRMPREESIVSPPSHCPACGHRLGFSELVPLFSFLWLKRRCKSCGVPISWRYFTIELICGLLFVLLFAACFPGRMWEFPFYAIFTACLLAIFMIDLEHMIIPDELVIACIAAAVIMAVGEIFGLGMPFARPLMTITIPWTVISFKFPSFIIGAIVGIALFIGIEIFSRLLFKKEGMGGGDMKLALAIGALLGPATALLSFGFAILLGALFGIVLIVGRLRNRVDYIPFGPFMVVTAFALMLAPRHIWMWVSAAWSWYMGTLKG